MFQISNGPSYHLMLGGVGVEPGLRFSFQNYNFGPCFIHRAGMPTHSATLTPCDLRLLLSWIFLARV